MKRVHVRGPWVDCHYRVGSRISIVPPIDYNDNLPYIIDGQSPALLCYDPENLISITTIADGVSCLRRAVLSTKMQPASAQNRPTIQLVSGSIAHEVFERCIFDPRKLRNEYNDLKAASIKGNLLTIFASGKAESEVSALVDSILNGFPAWCTDFLRPTPSEKGKVTDELKAQLPAHSKFICIPQVFSLEESITCQALGLKGKVDAVVSMRLSDPNNNDRMVSLMVPLELKTGKSINSSAHRAQTLLYTLLLGQKYQMPVSFGLLYYVASETLLRIAATPDELKALMMVRNRLASAAQVENPLPAPIASAFNCRLCPQLENCAILSSLHNEDPNQLNGTLESYKRILPNPMSGNSHTFHQRWTRMVTLEEKEALEEKTRRLELVSFGDLYYLKECVPSEYTSSAFGKYVAKFSLAEGDGENSWAESDPVIIFANDGLEQVAAIGFVLRSTNDTVEVHMDRDVGYSWVKTEDFEPFKNQSFVKKNMIGCTFMIQKDELLSGFSIARSNIVHLFSSSAQKLHSSVVELKEPRFTRKTISNPFPNLDSGQHQAIEHCISTEDYALLHGMPGTGKTTTLVALIEVLLSCPTNGNILISSYTHSAVDNLLIKLMNAGIPVLRLGNSDRIDSRLKSRIISSDNFPTTTSLSQAINGTRVYGTTCLGSNHPILSLMDFQWCIVDEASQITLPVSLGPLLLASRFVLVGDHYQLPPLVRSREASALGLNQSLFKILSEAHPQSVYTLRRQYRMCEDIQAVANRTVYQGRLECGSEKVRTGRLEIDPRILKSVSCSLCRSHSCWLKRLVQPDCRVVFVDTDEVNARETKIVDSYQNEVEARLIERFVNTLIDQCDISADRIGVISAFRPQILLLRQVLQRNMEISTVDRYQGRDKDCIILSFVRSNQDHNIGALLCDWHRLNVAFTRAKLKLVIFGSWSTIMQHDIMSAFKGIITENYWFLKLSSNALAHALIKI